MGLAVEVQLALHEKCSEFAQVGAIKGIWFVDFRSVTTPSRFSDCLRELLKCICEVRSSVMRSSSLSGGLQSGSSGRSERIVQRLLQQIYGSVR